MAEGILLKIPGRKKQSSELRNEASVHGFSKPAVKEEVEIAVAARGINADLHAEEIKADPDSNVIELEYEGGIRQFIHPEQLRDDLQKTQVSRGGTMSNVVEIPTDFGPATTRGKSDLVLKVLRVFGVDPVSAVSDQAVRLVISSFEDKLQPAPGLYRLKDPNTPLDQITDAKQLDATSPYLLFLHGTASSIGGSFGGLAPADGGAATQDWSEICKKYGKRILALQHKTFSESPVKNAIDVVNLLPTDAHLHVVSHSRGGLVGELLSITDLQDSHFEAFQRATNDGLEDVRNDKTRQQILEQRKQEVENIKQLAELIKAKRLTIDRFVRVACPARGTILLSGRLDLYLSVLLNLIGFIPPLKASILYDFIQATVLEIVRRRTDPRELPGIEAMMPDSPLVHILNQPAIRSRSDLAVISGDLAPDRFWKKLALMAVQVLYLEDNDLIVNTRSMYGGMARVTNASYFFNKGPHVNHFHYFINPGTRSRLKDWLLSAAGATVEGFAPFIPEQKQFKPDTRRAAEDTRPILFLIPDMLGTQLSRDNQLVWLSTAELASRGLAVLALEKDLTPSELVPEYYADIFNALSDSYQVRKFPYDWRKPLGDHLPSLAQQVTDAQDSKRRVVIVGHGTGGTLGLLLAGDKGFWTKFVNQGGRLVMLGSPINESGFARTLLTKRNSLNCHLNLVTRFTGKDAQDVFVSFPGILAFADKQAHANTLAKLLGDAVTPGPPPNVVYLAGKAVQTPMSVAENGTVRYTAAGDGHVTWAEARFLSVPAWLVDVPHGNLANSPTAISAIRELLAGSTTDKLPRLPGTPVVEEAAPSDEPAVLYPQDSDLIDAALGGRTCTNLEPPQPALRVWVSHGHLRHAQYPLIIGHYKDDSVVSAEKTLDRALDGRLTTRFAMGVYPGPDGTAEIMITPANKPPGALVIGLGAVGELTQEKLRRAVTNAVLRYSLAVTDSTCASVTDPTDIGFSTLLVGTYGGLTISESVTGIVKGILETNRLLKDQSPDKPIRISALEFVDMYEDVSIEAAHELLTLGERMNGDGGVSPSVIVEPTVRTMEGGQTSRPRNQYQLGWWRRVSISETRESHGQNGLRFTVLTDRAQTSDAVQGTQRLMVETAVRNAVTTVAYDKQLSGALFQLLWPHNLQSLASDKVNVVLVVDRQSAAYPWELLAQRTRTDFEPLATRSGLLRQFRSLDQQHRKSPAIGKGVLVIGDTMSGLQPLLGARQEAQAVSARLSNYRYDVTALPPDVEGLRVVTELLSREYRVIHIAAHGEVAEDKRPQIETPDQSSGTADEEVGRDKRSQTKAAVSGVVLGKDLWLSPNEILAMPAAPDLAFINCCYLGAIGDGAGNEKRSRHPGPEFASSFAETLMAIGTRAVIVAGWAVDDAAGRAFAERFYDLILEGVGFGDAVTQARLRVQDLYPGRNTWGSYQCYGNPDFCLHMTSATYSGQGAGRSYVSRLEVLQRAQDIAATANEVTDKDAVRKQLEELRERAPLAWRDGEVLGAIGKAYAALGDSECAIEFYRQALTDETSNARIKLIQDLGNLLERAARKKPAAEAERDLDQAGKLLQNLRLIIDTAELNSVLGAYYKRKAQFEQNPELRLDSYKQALAYYRAAYTKRKEMGDLELYYPGVNAAGLAYLIQSGTAQEWSVVLTECVAGAKERRKRVSDFWSRVVPADAFLVQTLWDNSTSPRKNEVIAAYDEVIKGGGAAYEFDSMAKQVEFLADGVQDPNLKATLQHIADVLRGRIPR
jgi:tetratricopeptide (TPR) repeat protein